MKKIAFVIWLGGTIGSIVFVLNAGRYSPIFLLIVFIGWVLSPYVALFLVNFVSKLRLLVHFITFFWMTLFISLGSLISYYAALGKHGTRSTAVYLIVPLISWVVILVVIAISANKRPKVSGMEKVYRVIREFLK